MAFDDLVSASVCVWIHYELMCISKRAKVFAGV